MTELINKTFDTSATVERGGAEINNNHFLMDNKLTKEVKGSIISSVSERETRIKIYDEYTSANKVMISEDHIFLFKPIYDKRVPTDARKRSFKSIQKWEGTVTEVDEDFFWARLVDLTSDDNATEEIVQISNDDVSSKDDLDLITPGAIFYWNIGYQTVNGQDSKTSIITFRRLPKWSSRKKDTLRQKGKKFMEGLIWE